MRSVRSILFLGVLYLLVTLATSAAEFRIQNGNVTGSFRLQNRNTLQGEMVDTNEDGMVVKLDIGGFSRRESWANLSQETLRGLSKFGGEVAKYVEPFIELSAEELKLRRQKREVVVRDVPERAERPSSRPSLITGFTSPMGLGLLFFLFLGNLYAAYEIAIFRQRSPMVICVLSAILPVLAPLVVLALPGAEATTTTTTTEEETAAAGAAARKTTGVVAAKPSSLSLAAAEKTVAASALSQPQVYARGDNTFNRRFFESKFPGFFRVVIGEAEKDLVIVIRTVKNEYVGRRISRISMNELHLQLISDGSEVSIGFGEIQTVILKHKDAKV